MLDYQAPRDLLKDKVILVTGAGDGIGREAALTYAAHGATVVLLGRTSAKLEAVYDQIEAAGHPLPAIVPVDLKGATAAHYRGMAETFAQQFGRLDGVLFNAGLLGTLSPFEHIQEKEWDEVMQVNVKSEFLLTQALLPLIRQTAQAHESTSFMLLLAAFQSLLHRYSGQRDIRIGVPNANRPRLETQGLVGFFINTQVLCARLEPRAPFSELLAQVRQATLDAQANQDLPFEQLVEAFPQAREQGLFQVMFNHQQRDLSALRRLPAYLQQLEMESNGKRVGLDGQPLPYATSPVLWGEPGTNGQHAFFQMLHQGTDVLPLELIAVRQPTHPLEGHHNKLLANALAQAQALMVGKEGEDGHRHFPGNRPSTFLLLDALTPASLGALIALQEHRVFVSGSLWGINSFDQWGVELGKVLAKDLEARLESGDVAGLDGSTAGLLARLRSVEGYGG